MINAIPTPEHIHLPDQSTADLEPVVDSAQNMAPVLVQPEELLPIDQVYKRSWLGLEPINPEPLNKFDAQGRSTFLGRAKDGSHIRPLPPFGDYIMYGIARGVGKVADKVAVLVGRERRPATPEFVLAMGRVATKIVHVANKARATSAVWYVRGAGMNQGLSDAQFYGHDAFKPMGPQVKL